MSLKFLVEMRKKSRKKIFFVNFFSFNKIDLTYGILESLITVTFFYSLSWNLLHIIHDEIPHHFIFLFFWILFLFSFCACLPYIIQNKNTQYNAPLALETILNKNFALLTLYFNYNWILLTSMNTYVYNLINFWF